MDADHTYSNGLHTRQKKERPKTVELGTLEKLSTNLPSKVQPDIVHTGPPKFRRKNSLENLLGDKGTKNSPAHGKKIPDLKSQEVNNNVSSDDDDDGYEEMVELTLVKPYAIHDVISPAERMRSSNRKNQDRPAPPPKTVTTMKPPVVPRVPRSNTVSSLGSAVEQRRGLGSITSIPKPAKIPPKVPHKKKNTESKEKEVGGQPIRTLYPNKIIVSNKLSGLILYAWNDNFN